MFVKTWHLLRTEGPSATAGAIARRVRKLAYVREQHVWYGCDLNSTAPWAELPQGLRLVRANSSQVDGVVAVGQDLTEARERFDEGIDLWLVLDGEDVPVFLCFIFRDATPVMAASDGTLELPARTACLEDAMTAPRARGQGIATAAWILVADELRRDGFSTLVAKIETANAGSKRVAEKAGFSPVAVMEHERTGVRRRTAVRPLAGGLGDELAARLS
ncbi:MAG: Acetyltransferase family [Thermoleophilaceae bacterium]|nr:Acetyltransferase family [Thermoleophilaceae bacterium]